jgi:hypothetical protein
MDAVQTGEVFLEEVPVTPGSDYRNKTLRECFDCPDSE